MISILCSHTTVCCHQPSKPISNNQRKRKHESHRMCSWYWECIE